MSSTTTSFQPIAPGRFHPFHIQPSPQREVCPVCHGLECLCRPRYFAGQLLSDQDLNAEQHYVIEKNKLHNLYLHGWGVVCGLQVSCHGSCEGYVQIGQGYAISPCGDDIIVCQAVPFDVLGAIEQCVRQQRQGDPYDCAPSRTIQDQCITDGVWCLTIAYEETASRAMTSLVNPPASNACSCPGATSCGCGCGCRCGGGCGCGGSRGGGSSSGASKNCGCGCNGSSTTTSTKACTGTSISKSTMAPGPANPACEPTRTCEGYKLGVCRQQADYRTPTYGDVLGNTLLGAITSCLDETMRLVSLAPAETETAEVRYARAVVMHDEILRSFASRETVTCGRQLRHVPAPPSDGPVRTVTEGVNAAADTYHRALTDAIDGYKTQVWSAFLECLCQSLLPPCPPDPGDDRLILACVEVRDGKVVDVCNFGARRQVISWPAIQWWLSLLPIGPLITLVLERLCCGGYGEALARQADNNALLQTRGSGFMAESFDAGNLVDSMAALRGLVAHFAPQQGNGG
jgi:hypothetical protein